MRINPHHLRPFLPQRLCGQHLPQLIRLSDRYGQRTECAVGRGVRIATGEQHPRLRQAKLGCNYVSYAMPAVVYPDML